MAESEVSLLEGVVVGVQLLLRAHQRLVPVRELLLVAEDTASSRANSRAVGVVLRCELLFHVRLVAVHGAKFGRCGALARVETG